MAARGGCSPAKGFVAFVSQLFVQHIHPSAVAAAHILLRPLGGALIARCRSSPKTASSPQGGGPNRNRAISAIRTRLIVVA
uniref:Putative secreted protein n=1 Tax=Anopheles triannulatus TaxID=58253 RepID=A0A2M4B331_9DIPT